MDNSAHTNNRRSVYQMLMMGSGGVAAQFVNLLTTPIITRLYAPESYATWAVVMSVVAILGALSTLRYELAIVLPKEESEAGKLFFVSLLCALLISTFTALMLGIFGDTLADILGVPHSGKWALLVCALIVVTGVTQACSSWCTRNARFNILSTYSITLVSLTFLGQVTAAFMGYATATGMMAGTILGQALAASYLFLRLCFSEERRVFRYFSFAGIQELAYKYRTYPMHMAPYTLFGLFRERVALYCMTAVAPKVDVGYYAFSSRLSTVPATFVGSAVRPVLFQRATNDDVRELERFIGTLQSFFILNTMPFFVFLLFNASDVFALVFGENWRPAGIFAILVSFPAYLRFLTTWLDRLMDVRGRQKLALALEALFSFLSVGCFLLGWWFTKSVMWAVGLQSAVLLVHTAIWATAAFRVAGFDTRLLLTRAKELLFVGAISVVTYLVLTSLLPFWPARILYVVLVVSFLLVRQRSLLARGATT